jgi:hypothetical protein
VCVSKPFLIDIQLDTRVKVKGPLRGDHAAPFNSGRTGEGNALALRLFPVATPTNQQTAAPRPPASPDLSPVTEISESSYSRQAPSAKCALHGLHRFDGVSAPAPLSLSLLPKSLLECSTPRSLLWCLASNTHHGRRPPSKTDDCICLNSNRLVALTVTT